MKDDSYSNIQQTETETHPHLPITLMSLHSERNMKALEVRNTYNTQLNSGRRAERKAEPLKILALETSEGLAGLSSFESGMGTDESASTDDESLASVDGNESFESIPLTSNNPSHHLTIKRNDATNGQRRRSSRARTKSKAKEEYDAALLASRGTKGDEENSPKDREKQRQDKLMARKIRNRESAALSRKRKAEHVNELEKRIEELEKENAELRKELKKQRTSPSSRQNKHRSHGLATGGQKRQNFVVTKPMLAAGLTEQTPNSRTNNSRESEAFAINL